jgi:hypothetical protein
MKATEPKYELSLTEIVVPVVEDPPIDLIPKKD